MAEVDNLFKCNPPPKPGSPDWLEIKRHGPRWSWQDATGIDREGYMERFSDRGGTDVTYFMRRDPCGTLDLVSGSRAKAMKRVHHVAELKQ